MTIDVKLARRLHAEGRSEEDIAFMLDVKKSEVRAALSQKQPPAPPPEEPVPLMLDVAQLQPGQCRWPHGDPRKPGFGFCAAPNAPGRPYCAFHARKAYLGERKIKL
jgi:hypothetical protein